MKHGIDLGAAKKFGASHVRGESLYGFEDEMRVERLSFFRKYVKAGAADHFSLISYLPFALIPMLLISVPYQSPPPTLICALASEKENNT